MKSPTQLIQDGIQKGTLIQAQIWPFTTFQFNGEVFICIDPDGWYQHGDSIPEGDNEEVYELTTAFDALMNADSLICDEPFWTRWFIFENRDPMKLDPINSKNEFSLVFSKEGHAYDIELCRPCLPPKTTV
jgi:hypothetical protein